MSKHRLRRDRTSRKPPPEPPITAESPASAIIAEKIRIQLEMLRRREYAALQALRAELAEMPPVPDDHPS